MTAHGVGGETLPSRSGYPLVVVTLPGRDAESLREQARRASEAGADLVEIRLDRLPEAEIDRLDRVHAIPLTAPWVPAIATLRSRADGGEGPNDPPARAAVLERALGNLPFSVVDLELQRDLDLAPRFQEVDGRPMAFVRSAHLPEGTPTGRVLELLQAGISAGGVAKVVLPADARRTVEDLIPAVAPLHGRPYVLHTSGGAGALLRVLAPRLGMAWVFCRLPEEGGGPPPDTVEPSQVPVDRMRRFVDAGPEAPWFAIVGHPLGHTASPALYASLLERTRTDGIYIPLEVTSEGELLSVLSHLPSLGLRGLNVTRPYKTAAFDLAAQKTEGARACRAANTLVALAPPAGGFRAHNTDVEALDRWWGELLGPRPRSPPVRVLVVGTGGAARAAVVASLRHRLETLLVGRRPEAASALAEEVGAGKVQVRSPGALSPVPWVVHATPVGQDRGAVLDVPLERAIERGGLVIDLVYRPVEPRVREAAERAGAHYVDGMRMLVYQAALSFELFTGRKPSAEALSAWLPAPRAGGAA